MADKNFPYQPGAMLHRAIVGAFRARGGGFEKWCKDNGITSSNARNVTCGMSKGPRSKALLNRLIEAAGSDIVEAAYLASFERHMQDIKNQGSSK